jgi:hypothetical protein
MHTLVPVVPVLYSQVPDVGYILFLADLISQGSAEPNLGTSNLGLLTKQLTNSLSLLSTVLRTPTPTNYNMTCPMWSECDQKPLSIHVQH